MQKIMSGLHGNIQDNFHGEGVEISLSTTGPTVIMGIAITNKYIETENN